MTVTFFINYLNHHQVFVADEMYRRLGDNFRFVATFPRNERELKGGIDYSTRPYCLLPTERPSDMEKASELIVSSDVCVFGAGNLEWEKIRSKTNKLSFEISERWFKRGIINLLSPRLLKWWWLYQTRLRFKPFYKLCASAYTASDCRKLGAFKKRCFKWGYFTDVPELDFSTVINKDIMSGSTVEILWVARFLKLKHPESMLQLAMQLRTHGFIHFEITMIGNGPEYENIKQKIASLQLTPYIKLTGAISNDEVLDRMRKAHIFCFTSDKNEGWGAVLNEAMSNGCCVVANEEIGAVPFLIRNGINGLTYHKGNVSDLISCVEQLLNNPTRCCEMGRMAFKDMHRYWNPVTAAQNLISLSQNLMHGKGTPVPEGPCSKA